MTAVPPGNAIFPAISYFHTLPPLFYVILFFLIVFLCVFIPFIIYSVYTVFWRKKGKKTQTMKRSERNMDENTCINLYSNVEPFPGRLSLRQN